LCTRAARRAGHAGDAVPDLVPQRQGSGQDLRSAHRRPLLRRDLGLSIGHVSPEAAEGGTIGLVEEGDRIRIDIPNRQIDLLVEEATLAKRRQAMEANGDKAFQPNRDRTVSQSLQAYALMTTSAARGAVRDISQLIRKR